MARSNDDRQYSDSDDGSTRSADLRAYGVRQSLPVAGSSEGSAASLDSAEEYLRQVR